MINLTTAHFIGIIGAMLIMIFMGVYSGRQVKNSVDFEGGGNRASSAIVCGTIVGTLVGGSSTIGTAQLAYIYGMSACWYTFGSAIACFLLGVLYCKPVFHHKNPTVSGMVKEEFGTTAGKLASLFCAGGSFISLVAQLISAVAVWAIILPNVSTEAALVITIVLVTFYAVFGGVLGTGIIGVFKLGLLYVAVVGGGCYAAMMLGGIGGIVNNQIFIQGDYFNFLGRGWSTDIGALLSAVFGTIGSQVFIGALKSGRDEKTARTGALISACVIPPIGIGAICIGLYMRQNFPDLASAKLALPLFVTNCMPPLLGGCVLATLLITVLGSSAGLVLAVNSIFNNDFVQKVTDKFKDTKKNLTFSRICVVMFLCLGGLLSTGAFGDTIMDFGFLAQGLRGVAVVLACSAALFWPGKFHPKYVITAMILGPVAIFFGKVLDFPIDALMCGFIVAVPIMMLGALANRKKHL